MGFSPHSQSFKSHSKLFCCDQGTFQEEAPTIQCSPNHCLYPANVLLTKASCMVKFRASEKGMYRACGCSGSPELPRYRWNEVPLQTMSFALMYLKYSTDLLKPTYCQHEIIHIELKLKLPHISGFSLSQFLVQNRNNSTHHFIIKGHFRENTIFFFF